MSKYDKLILVVDDVAYIRIQIKKILNSAGYKNIVFASNGIEAFQKISSLHPELILLDIFLPKINGISLINLLKMLNYKYKILVISAAENMELYEAAIRNGALDWLRKPIISNILIEKVNKLIDLQISEDNKQQYLDETNDFSENIGIKLNSLKSLQILLLYGKLDNEEFNNLKETMLALRRYNYKNVIINLNGISKIEFDIKRLSELKHIVEKEDNLFCIVASSPDLKRKLTEIGIDKIYHTEAEAMQCI